MKKDKKGGAMTFEEKHALTQGIVAKLAAACPIGDCSFGRLTDKATWKVPPLPVATPAQRTALAVAIAGIDLSAVAGPVALAEAAKADAVKLMTGSGPDDVRFRALARATFKQLKTLIPSLTWPQFKAAILAEMSSDDPTT